MSTRILLFVFVLIGFISINSCENLQEDDNTRSYKNPIKIGVVGDITIGRDVAENNFLGVKLAADEINSQGGITINNTTHEIELIFKNSDGNPEVGLQVIEEFIDQNIHIIIGPTISQVAMDMAKRCIEKNILMISYSSTIPDLSELIDRNLIWRTCPSDVFSGDIMASYTMDSLEITKAAILYRDDNFGRAMKDIIQYKYESIGGEIVAVTGYPTDDTELNLFNFSTYLNDLLIEKPGIIFSAIFELESGKITQDIWASALYQNYEVKPPLFLVEGGFLKELTTNGQPDVVKTILGISSSTSNNPNYITFENNYIEEYGFSPTSYTEHAYDALYSVAYAIQKSQSTQTGNIAENLRLVTGGTGSNENAVKINTNEFTIAKNLLEKNVDINYNGPSGSIAFDENGDPKSAFVIWEIKNGEYNELTYIEKR
ncbi:MAG: hypothetical protein A2X13_09440 [Bacteroidetes bacterium GWC2_33_15]|nr:MAG: hypothetical protein A2X10_10935 [Bacteroidetes bacterium GWA2_33_15]OFX48929.1 MAG: hypothetical protein A2X13_09440 [Bacteroidetes bacterium GWC2_33_15]OFX64807.1 MAG: hypothetical protein A2X15_05775 [Bacteroidetes bacterium GWB2_32_14]OFX68509.1 MAG: hypothetical protein A2X14_15330 [Bacteroidetes bacterium GWD2_33_33]HAN19239.1 hypothetical protein [Bacteroidales bacterium]